MQKTQLMKRIVAMGEKKKQIIITHLFFLYLVFINVSIYLALELTLAEKNWMIRIRMIVFWCDLTATDMLPKKLQKGWTSQSNSTDHTHSIRFFVIYHHQPINNAGNNHRVIRHSAHVRPLKALHHTNEEYL